MVLFGDIYGYEGNWSRALACSQAANERAQRLADAYLHLSVESGLVLAGFKTGHFHEAEASLRRAFDLAKTLGQTSAYPQLYWLEGLGAVETKNLDQAEESLRRALNGFQELEDFNYSAAVALELAIVLTWLGRRPEVLEVARGALPILRELELNDECLLLITVLEKAIGEQKIETALLFSLRSQLGAELGMLELLANQERAPVPP